MSAKPIREYDAKLLIYSNDTLKQLLDTPKLVSVTKNVSVDSLVQTNNWLTELKLVCKPDMLLKRRGKNNLLALNNSLSEIKDWIAHKSNVITIGNTSGILDTFIIEPFIPHEQQDEFYLCIYSLRDCDRLMICLEGGVDVGNVDEKAKTMDISLSTNKKIDDSQLDSLVEGMDSEKKEIMKQFAKELYLVYCDMHFTYMEINPIVITKNKEGNTKVYVLDMAAKIDQTAEFICGSKWSKALYPNVDSNVVKNIEFPAPFGRELTPEEKYIQELDSKTGASLKLTILNPKGRIWTLVAGGGASVVYSDAIAALGIEYAKELANYGEYSGAPSTSQTYEYAKTILDLMTRDSVEGLPESVVEGKVLFIGGGIANFTNVAATFKGIVKALVEYQHDIIKNKIKIYVRRAGPNYQEGLKAIKQLAVQIKVDIKVFGPETHITAIVPMALTPGQNNAQTFEPYKPDMQNNASEPETTTQDTTDHYFTKKTKAIVFGMQLKAVQGMLDFDYICKRDTHSVAAIVYPFGGNHMHKFYWGTSEIMIPVYSEFATAVDSCAEADTVVNFASCRSVYNTTMDIIQNHHSKIKTIAIIAEGVPERHTRELILHAKLNKVSIIGPATVGGIKPGCFKIGNTGGMMDNIVVSKLYRPGSVGYVSKSGGMSNELNNIVSLTTDGVYEGVAIGGDKYPATTFIDHLLRYENDPNCKILLLLGEVGGIEEYTVCEAIKNKTITKPLVAWCIGTCATMFTTDVQFGHAGSMANSDQETASAKNMALKEAGALVPNTFEDLPILLKELFVKMVKEKMLIPKPEVEEPKIPIDFSWAMELGLVRKPASFVSSISDERGEELLYAGMKISKVFEENIGIGGVVSLLWFKRRLPEYCCKFIEMVLMLTADHGPAVSGAHNTIVTARAGKDLVSSLATGLLTIGDRFGGALDGAASMFSSAYDKGLTPREFVDSMRKQNKLIMGIGHKIKSRNNPDLRVSIVKDFAKQHFPATPILDYALAVEQITTSKKENLILNVDGAIGVVFVDLLRHCGAFSSDEAEEYIKIGTLNGLFVLGRSAGFIGHYLDQVRLKQGLYRHPWDDISYITPESQPSYTQRAFVEADQARKSKE